MRRRTRAPQVDAERLASRSVSEWLSDAERARVGVLVDVAREEWQHDPRARTDLDRLAPGTRFPAQLIGSRSRAIAVVERLVVDHRRRIAANDYANSSRETVRDVADRFHLGHLSHDEETRFIATGLIA